MGSIRTTAAEALLTRDTLSAAEAASAADSTPTTIDEEPPYSVTNELRYFVRVGLPLCATAILKLGVPPFFTMM